MNRSKTVDCITYDSKNSGFLLPPMKLQTPRPLSEAPMLIGCPEIINPRQRPGILFVSQVPRGLQP
jgi:hypothetical protein